MVASISTVSLLRITPGGMASKTRLKGTSAVYSFENLVKNQNTKDRPKKRRKNRSFCFCREIPCKERTILFSSFIALLQSVNHVLTHSNIRETTIVIEILKSYFPGKVRKECNGIICTFFGCSIP